MRGSASPQGEARREAPPSPSEARGAEGGLRGGGGRVDVTKPPDANSRAQTLVPDPERQCRYTQTSAAVAALAVKVSFT